MKNSKIILSTVAMLTLASCGNKSAEQPSPEPTAKHYNPLAETNPADSIQQTAENNWDTVLDQYEVVIDEKNKLTEQANKGDSLAVEQVQALAVKQKQFEDKVNKLPLTELTEEQILRIGKLQKKQRVELNTK